MRKQLGLTPVSSLDEVTKGYVDGAVVTVTAATYTASNRNYILANCAANNVTITVPNTAGNTVTVKRVDASVNTLTVVPSSGTIDGDANATLVGIEVAATFVGDGTNVGVVAVNGSQYQNTSVSGTANTLALRDGNGRTQFVNPAAAADAATKGYVDGLYTAPAVAATANTLALRDASGRTQFVNPAAAQDAATKSYVDAMTAPGFRQARSGRTGVSDNFGAGSFATLAGVTLPSNAPNGIYLVSLCCGLSSTASCTAYYRLNAPNGGDMTADDSQALPAGTRMPYNFSDIYAHTGGAGGFTASAQVSAGTGTVWNASFHLSVVYLGQ
jgi:hypothetical protein